MSTLRNQLICAYSFIPYSISLAIGLFVLPRWLPPFDPALDPAAMAALFREDMATRIGIAILAFFSPFFLGIWVAMAAQLRRMEGEGHLLSNLMLLSSVLQIMAIQLPCFPLMALMFRPELDDQLFVIFSTTAWFMFLGAAGQAFIQMFSIGLCILTAVPDRQVFPRWLGYVNMLAALSSFPGVLLMFFKTGPFAWNGLFGFWVVLVGFSIWATSNFLCTLSAIKTQMREQRAALVTR